MRRFLGCLIGGFLVCFIPCTALAQNSQVQGQVTDPQKAVVPNAEVHVINQATGVERKTKTNEAGMYSVPFLEPGHYKITVQAAAFNTAISDDLTLNVGQGLVLDVELKVGSTGQQVTVSAGPELVNTTDGSVSTVVDRQFAENLPMNGRSFQTLIQLTPGVVLTAYNQNDNGQFSVNGQRAASNYWLVDGVSANIGIGTLNAFTGNGLAGANAGLSVLGGTNSLVSVDALQEFRIQTSTYAPEFGRTPGGQVSIVTRSGTNQWHGTAFDYVRNDVLDANDWFANKNGLQKPKERQNDFGGTFSGAILRDRAFFFFSYEGLRLRLPRVAESLVPNLNARQSATPAMQPYLKAFPLPSPGTPDNLATGIANFNASFSNSASLDAYNLRIDHKLGNHLTVFGRYNYSPSKLIERDSSDLSNVKPSRITIQTATGAVTWVASSAVVDDLRFNYSRTHSKSYSYMDSFGGAVPLASVPFPSGFDLGNANFGALWLSLNSDGPSAGPNANNLQRQINIVDSLSVQKERHSLKFGLDFRRLSPFFGNPSYSQIPVFGDVPSSQSGRLLFAVVGSGRTGTFVFHNLSAFAQDTWRVVPALTVTYGLRWDVDFAPSSNPAFLAVTGFSLKDYSNLALAPAGTPPFQTTYGSVAPRIGVAYRITGGQNWQTVVRGGFGVFYDLVTSESGNAIQPGNYPFGATNFASGTFPLSASDAGAPRITGNLPLRAGGVFDPHIELPYTLQWNVAVEQALGSQHTLSVSYVGAAGRRLIQTASVASPTNPTFSAVWLTANAATSDYDALQLQFRRRLSKGLQALASYTWSHSIDTASAGSINGNVANGLLPTAINQNRGPSDFDIRNAFSVAVTFDVPAPKSNAFTNTILRGWSIENIFEGRSAPPVTIFNRRSFTSVDLYRIVIRPDVVAGQPLNLYGSQCLAPPPLGFGQPCPGGKGFNPNAFVTPPTGRQGNLGRNALRGFGAWQWDFAVHRDFSIHELIKLQFRAEMFNVLNHPSFAPPVADITNRTQFGRSTQTLGNYLAGRNLGSGAFSPLYQIGGPRTVQFGLKFQF